MSDEKVPPQKPSDDKPASEPSPASTPPPASDQSPGTPPPPAGSGSSTGAAGSTADSGGGGSAPPPPSSGAGGAGSAGTGAPPPPPSGGGGTGGPPPSGAAGDNRTLMLVLSYLWVLALVPYLMEQRDPEVKWHARHGLVLLVAEILLNVVLFILSLIPGVGCIFSIVWMLIPLGLIVLHVILIVKAVNGERYTIPYVSQYADQIP